MSLPLVEKYRPKTKTDLIGNEVAINGLILFLKRWTPRKAPMASLLLGPAGSGKTSSVYAIAKDLGYTIIDPQGPHGGLIGVLHIHTCFELPCTGNYKTDNLSYILYCPISVVP